MLVCSILFQMMHVAAQFFMILDDYYYYRSMRNGDLRPAGLRPPREWARKTYKKCSWPPIIHFQKWKKQKSRRLLYSGGSSGSSISLLGWAYFSETEVPPPNRQRFGGSVPDGNAFSRQAPDSLNDKQLSIYIQISKYRTPTKLSK